MLLQASEITLDPHALDMFCKYSIIIKRLFGATSLACLDKFWIFPQIPGRLKIFTTLTNSIKGIYFAVTSFHGRITSRDCRAPDRRNSSKFLIFFSLHFPRNRNWNVSFHTWFILLLAIFVFHCTSVCSLSEITDIFVFWSGSCSLRVFLSL